MESTPLHPLIVHFPIALLLLATVIEILALWKRERLNTTGTILLGVGFLSGIVSFITGEGGEHYAKEKWGDSVEELIHTHENFALLSMIFFGGAFGLKIISYFWPKHQKHVWYLVVLLAIIGSIMLALTGNYGGKIVYQ